MTLINLIYRDRRLYDWIEVIKDGKVVKKGFASDILNNDKYLYSYVYRHIFDAYRNTHYYYI